MSPIRILIVDDHEVVRAGIAAIFHSENQFQIVGEARNGREAIRLYDSLRPDIALMDIRLPSADGLEALHAIRKSDPSARVIILAADSFESDIYFARQAGACGYLTKDIARQQLLAEIRQAIKTGFCSPFDDRSAGAARAPTEHPLTDREQEVLAHMRRGLSNVDIAKALTISEQTVKSHVAAILHSLGAASRAEAVAIGFEIGLLRTGRHDSSSDLASKLPNPTKHP